MKLSDTHLVLLNAAAQRDDGLLHPCSAHDDDRRSKIVRQLTKLGLVDEIAIETSNVPGCWLTNAEGATGLRINAAGLRALGLDDGTDETTGTVVAQLVGLPRRRSAKRERRPSKIGKVLALLARSEGASIEELCTEVGWLPHTMRAALSGLRKKGYAVVLSSAMPEGRRAYHLTAPSAGLGTENGAQDEVR